MAKKAFTPDGRRRIEWDELYKFTRRMIDMYGSSDLPVSSYKIYEELNEAGLCASRERCHLALLRFEREGVIKRESASKWQFVIIRKEI